MRIIKMAAAILLVAALCVGWASPVQAAAEYKVALVPSQKPFQFLENDRPAGAHIEILDQIGRNKYITFSYVTYETQTLAYKAMEQGEADLILGVCIDQKPPGNVIFTAGITQDNVSMLTKRPISIEKTKPYSCAIPQDIFDSRGFIPLANTGYWICSSSDDAYRRFSGNSCDLLIGPRASLHQFRTDNPARNYSLSNSYISTISYGIALPATSKTFLQQLNNEILQLKITGSLDRINKKWITEEMVPQQTLDRIILIAVMIGIAALVVILGVIQLNNYLQNTVETQTAELKQTNLNLEEQIIKVRNVNELRDCLIQNNTCAIIVFNEQEKITIFNDRAKRMTGLNIAPIGMNIWEIDFVRKLIGDKRDVLFLEESPPFEEEKALTDDLGNVRTYKFDVFPLYTPKNDVRAINLMISDTTEENRLRDERDEREKSRALNRIVAGMAHELRNPMTTIKAFVELMPGKQNDESFRQQMVEIVPGEIERIDSLLTNLIEYAKPSNYSKEVCEITKSVADTVELMQHIAQKNSISLTFSANHSCHARLSAAQLRQILINLILNGIDAATERDGGRRDIEIRVVSSKEFAYISVRDHGVGMTPEQAKSAIEPFYSTKWNGTGLGLYIVKQYIEQNDGTLMIESKDHEGTRIVMKFPLLREKEAVH